MDMPSSAARSIFRRSSRAATSSARSATVAAPASGEAAKRRASTPITRWWAASASPTPDQMPREKGNGCSNTSAAPLPRSSYPIMTAKLPQAADGLQDQRGSGDGPRRQPEGGGDAGQGGPGARRVVEVHGAQRVAGADP